VTNREWLRVSEVADELDVAPATVQRWVKAGKLRGRKIGGLWFVHRSTLEAYSDEHEGEGTGAERASRGDAVPATPGPTLGRDGDDAGRPPSFSVSRIEDRGRGPAGGTQTAARPVGQGRSFSAAPWTVPADVAE
jgi:excisionase family DNA binding protein